MGYELKSGEYNKKLLSEEEMWETVDWLFSSRSKNDTSYKFIFFKALVDCFEKRDITGKISFDRVFMRFTEISWNIILKYGVIQKAITNNQRETVLEQILKGFLSVRSSCHFIGWDELNDEEHIKINKKVKASCKRYVVGALFSDMNELLYSFDKHEEWIEFNPVMLNFIKSNKSIIETLNYHKWSKFYESINDVNTKETLESLLATDFALKNESPYRVMLAYEFERTSEDFHEYIIPNTLELLFDAEAKASDTGEEEFKIDEQAYEDEMYESYEKMRNYLKDPILLISKLKENSISSC